VAIRIENLLVCHRAAERHDPRDNDGVSVVYTRSPVDPACQYRRICFRPRMLSVARNRALPGQVTALDECEQNRGDANSGGLGRRTRKVATRNDSPDAMITNRRCVREVDEMSLAFDSCRTSSGKPNSTAPDRYLEPDAISREITIRTDRYYPAENQRRPDAKSQIRRDNRGHRARL
jgi:hypothetical protein